MSRCSPIEAIAAPAVLLDPEATVPRADMDTSSLAIQTVTLKVWGDHKGALITMHQCIRQDPKAEDFTKVEPLGSGNGGVVWKVRYTSGELMALKVCFLRVNKFVTWS
jgi:hypothetical protein